VYATFLSRRRLNKPGSEKETWHIDIDLTGTDLDYVVGDSFGVFPANDHNLVTGVLAALDVPGDFPSATAPSASNSPTASRFRRRPTCCSSSSPT
jgi:sulfite reductase alpha subunit-like flavoprotein